MSRVWFWVGVGVALIGVLMMSATAFMPPDEEPLKPRFLEHPEELIEGAIVMFVGFGIITFGNWICRRSS